MDLIDTMHVSAAGMSAQSQRLKIVAENLANADAVGTRDGKEPYRRKTISFKDALDRESGQNLVKTDRIGTDPKAFEERYEPNNPNADDKGYVLYPNVEPMIEMVDMREARRGYEANLGVIESSKSMLSQTIGLLR